MKSFGILNILNFLSNENRLFSIEIKLSNFMVLLVKVKSVALGKLIKKYPPLCKLFLVADKQTKIEFLNIANLA